MSLRGTTVCSAMNESFANRVKQSFSFSEDVRFRRTKEEPGLAHYESDRSFVTVSWDSRSGELDAFVGLLPRTGKAQDAYSIADILGAAGVQESDCKLPQVANERRLKICRETRRRSTHVCGAGAGWRSNIFPQARSIQESSACMRPSRVIEPNPEAASSTTRDGIGPTEQSAGTPTLRLASRSLVGLMRGIPPIIYAYCAYIILDPASNRPHNLRMGA